MPILINWYPNGYSQESHYFLLAVKLDRWVGIPNALNDLSNKLCIRNNTENENLSMFNMITGINNNSTILTKHISCKCKYKFDGRKCISYQKRNNVKFQRECENHQT